MEPTPIDTSRPLGVADDQRAAAERPESFSFGCDDCSLRHSEHCDDCVVAYLCAADDGAVVVTIDELRLVRHLQAGGLAPPLRYRRSTSAAG